MPSGPALNRIARIATVQLNDPAEFPVRLVASRARRRTVSAVLRHGVLEVRVPAHLSRREQEEWAERMRQRFQRRIRRARPNDAGLDARAQHLNRTLFGGRLRWTSIAWASNQVRRWGSCAIDATIRISDRAQGLPPWVLDYILVHELAHLERHDHSPAFWDLVYRYPLTERARGYLMAIDHQAGEDADAD